MSKIYVGLGSNLGDKKLNITNATILLGSLMGDLKVLSSLYETEPWGFRSDNKFLNAVVLLETNIEPQMCLEMAKAIEREMGRVYTHEGYEDRLIDVDILLYDDRVIRTETLTLPHPLMHERDFVLKPMVEIAPDLQHPLLRKTMKELLCEINK